MYSVVFSVSSMITVPVSTSLYQSVCQQISEGSIQVYFLNTNQIDKILPMTIVFFFFFRSSHQLCIICPSQSPVVGWIHQIVK